MIEMVYLETTADYYSKKDDDCILAENTEIVKHDFPRKLGARADTASYFPGESGFLNIWQPLLIMSNIGKGARVRTYSRRLPHTFALQYLKLGGGPYSLQYLLATRT